MTPEQAVDIIRNPDEYCVASRQEARLLLANEWVRNQEQIKIAELKGRQDMQNEIIDKLGSYDANKCAQIAASITANKDGFIPEALCFCNKEISLQIVSGGGAEEGLYGRITCRLSDGTYQDYVKSGDPWPSITENRNAR